MKHWPSEFPDFNGTSNNPVYSDRSYDMTGMRWVTITLLAGRLSFLGICVSPSADLPGVVEATIFIPCRVPFPSIVLSYVQCY